jgi:hypothetical protein
MMPNDPSNGFKETELGPLPEEWEVVWLGEVATRAFGGGTPSTKEADFWDGPIPSKDNGKRRAAFLQWRSSLLIELSRIKAIVNDTSMSC